MGNIVVKAALKYLESHPDVVEELIGALIKHILESLKEDKKEA